MFYIKRKSDDLYPSVWMCGEICGCEYVKYGEDNSLAIGFGSLAEASEYMDYLIKEYYLEDEYYIEEV